MNNFQVTATLSNGALVMFGVAADGETAALLRAYQRLSGFSQQAEQVQLIELPGSRRP